MVQRIPEPVFPDPDTHEELHKIKRSGRTNNNWLTTHQHFINSWNDRYNTVVEGNIVRAPTIADDYLDWYIQRTVIYITNPANDSTANRGFQNDGSSVQLLV